MSQVQAMTDVDPSPTLGELIAEQRAARRMSRPQLALLVGASLSSVKNWETDRAVPSPANLALLEDALGVRFVADATGRYSLEPAPDAAPTVHAPRVVVVVASTAEAMQVALDRLGVPRGE